MANKYAPIWEQLKEKKYVVIAVPVPLHKRVLKGLINCKNRDTAFKLHATEIEKKRYIIKYVAEAARIKIFLRAHDNLSAISFGDL